MHCLTQLIPPTAVTHAITLPFLSSSANNLVVAKTSLLQVFGLKSTIAASSPGGAREESHLSNGVGRGRGDRNERTIDTKLVLLAEYELAGTVTALCRVKTRSRSGGEAVLVALKDAKLSLVEWDPEAYTLSTVSIHYYERVDLQGPPWAPDLNRCVTRLAVEPSSQCAAFMFGSRQVAMVLFRQAGDDLVMEDYSPTGEPTKRHDPLSKANGHATPHPISSFVLSLLTLDPMLIHPIDLAFLHGYREPTLAILSSRMGPSLGLLHERRDIVALTVYTLDLEQRASTTLLSVDRLPFDIHRIIPLPPPIGGLLLVGDNEIIHVAQNGKTHGVAVNEFSRQSSAFALSSQSDLDMRLEGCVFEHLGTPNGEMLIILNSGELAILRFVMDGKNVSAVSVQRVKENNGGRLLSAAASCASPVGRGRIFVGCDDADSVVLGWSSNASKIRRQQRSSPQLSADVDSSGSEADGGNEEDDLYSSAQRPEPSKPSLPMIFPTTGELDEYTFRIHDSLLNLAPQQDYAFVGATGQAAGSRDKNPPRLDLVIAAGRGRAGRLLRMTPSVVLREARLDAPPGTTRIWSLFAARSASNAGGEKLHNTVMTSARNERGEDVSHVYSRLSSALEELPGSDFDPSAGATIEAATFMNGARIIQVLQKEVRTFDGGESIYRRKKTPPPHTLLQEPSTRVAEIEMITLRGAKAL
jgi:cleavage and polyadenylation specificity factor subunit 1